jgi:hypothetical protein
MEYQPATQTGQRELQRKPQAFTRPTVASAATTHSLRQFHQSFGNRAAGRLIQAKLMISQPADQYEQEADRVAATVMNSSDPAEVTGRVATSQVQRACRQCEDEEEEKHGATAAGMTVQRKERGSADVGSVGAVAAPAGVLPVSGEPLSRTVRAFFEPRFGQDFGSVRVHTGVRAAESAQAVGALAFTVGSDIVFGAGQFSTQTAAGQSLLAHELAHVVQQGQSAPLAAVGSALRLHTQPPHPVGLFRQIVTQLNYANLADRLYEAMFGGFLGLGTDEEQVYLALQQLQRDATAITILERTYAERHRNHDLVADIRDEFSGEELEYALQLLNLGRAGAAQAVGVAPSTPQDFENSARRLRRAVQGLGTDEEAIYAVLLPLDRNMQLIHQLMRTYADLFDHENLRERIIEEMSGSELDYALYLLGGPPVRANVEITEVTEGEADRLFMEVATLGFWTSADTLAPIPFHYPIDGCYARAQLMADRLTELGYASEKVFAVSLAGGAGLHVRSDYAADMRLANQPAVNDPLCAPSAVGPQNQPTVTWWYHVAPIIRVRDAQGQVGAWVLDPSMADRPITIRDWTAKMRNEQFTTVRVDDIPALRSANASNFPAATPVAFSTDRDVFWPTGPYEGPEPTRAATDVDKTRPTLSLYYARAMFHDLAALIREQMRNPTLNVDLLVLALQNATAFARLGLRRCFPYLLTALRARLSAPDVARIDVELNRP